MVFSKEDRILIHEMRIAKGIGRIRDVNHLKERLIEEWSSFDQKIIDGSIGQWRKRLRACISVDGGHFEQKL